MKRVILLIFYAMICFAPLHADNEPDFYFEGLGYNIMSKTDLTCEIGKSSYGGEVITRPTVEYQGKTFTVLGVGSEAFHLSRCTQATIGNGITYIGSDAFSICSNLRKVTLTPSIIDLGSNSFGYNEKLEEVVVEDGDEELIFQKTMVNFSPFENTSIKKLYVGRNHNKDVFLGSCKQVTDLELGDKVTKFELSEFPSLRRLIIGKNLDFLPYMDTGDYLTSITVKAETPQNIGGFTKRTYLNATLFVPKGTKELYEKAAGWSEFWDIREYVPTNITNNRIDKSRVVKEYSLEGIERKGYSKAVRIVRKSNGSTLKIFK